MTDLQPYYSPELPSDEHEYAPPSRWEQPAEPAPTNQVRRYFAALLRYKWLVVLAILAGGGAAFGAWRIIRPEYLAQGALWISEERQSALAGPISEAGLLQSSYAW